MKVTIVGSGFGGVKAALELAKHAENRVTLITDKSDFQYYPALYGTATGMSHLQSWVPLGEIFAGYTNIDIILDTIVTLDSDDKTVIGATGTRYRYSKLILALGSVTTYFGIEGLDTYAYGIKSAGEIKRLKQHLAAQFMHPKTLDKHMVIVGAGPTGVELASALGAYLEHLSAHYHAPRRHITIDLIEAAPRVLPKMSEATSAKVLERLKSLGVNVETGKAVQAETVDALMVSGKPIKSHTVIWTSGVANNPFYAANASEFNLAKNGRVQVDEYMRASSDVYVIGDNALTPFGGLAQTALKDAVFVARNLMRRHPRKYHATLPPVVVPVGEDWAAFEYKKIKFTGRAGALMRSAADFIGYHDIMPIGHALGVWHAQRIEEDDYFPAIETLPRVD